MREKLFDGVDWQSHDIVVTTVDFPDNETASHLNSITAALSDQCDLLWYSRIWPSVKGLKSTRVSSALWNC